MPQRWRIKANFFKPAAGHAQALALFESASNDLFPTAEHRPVKQNINLVCETTSCMYVACKVSV